MAVKTKTVLRGEEKMASYEVAASSGPRRAKQAKGVPLGEVVPGAIQAGSETGIKRQEQQQEERQQKRKPQAAVEKERGRDASATAASSPAATPGKRSSGRVTSAPKRLEDEEPRTAASISPRSAPGGKKLKIKRVKKRGKDSLPTIVSTESLPRVSMADLGLAAALDDMPELEMTPERNSIFGSLSSSRMKFWACIHAACKSYPALNFLSFRGDDACQYPYLAWWPMDVFHVFQLVYEAGGVTELDKAREGPQETMAEDGIVESWTGAWEKVFLESTRFMGDPDAVNEVPWRRAKMRRMYWDTVGQIMEKTPTSLFRETLATLADAEGDESSSIFSVDYMRCVCGHCHEVPLRGRIKICGGCASNVKGKFPTLKCVTCGVLQHERCAEDFGLLFNPPPDDQLPSDPAVIQGVGATTAPTSKDKKDVEKGKGGSSREEESESDLEAATLDKSGEQKVKLENYRCEICLGMASGGDAKLFYARRMYHYQKSMMDRTPALYKYEMPQDWACTYVFRHTESCANGDWYVQRGFAQIVNGANMACIRSKPALEKFLAPTPQGRLVDDPSVDKSKYIAGYSAKRPKKAPAAERSKKARQQNGEDFTSI